jgi:hypothetical protein
MKIFAALLLLVFLSVNGHATPVDITFTGPPPLAFGHSLLLTYGAPQTMNTGNFVVDSFLSANACPVPVSLQNCSYEFISGQLTGTADLIRFSFGDGVNPGGTSVPEPSSVALLCAGMAVLGIVRRRISRA